MREKILAVIEKNSRIDIHDLAILLGRAKSRSPMIAEMEKEHIICGYHTLINWDNTSEEKSGCADRSESNSAERNGI